MKKLWFDASRFLSQMRRWYQNLPIYIVGCLILANPWMSASAQSTSKTSRPPKGSDVSATIAVSRPHAPLKDGIHLFGQAQVPGQLQTEYLIFKMKRKQVIGAFFMPSSSFDCFAGKMTASQLNLTIEESYEQQTYNHNVNLNQYHAISQISNNDLRILDVCTVHYSNHTAQEP